MSWQSQRSTLPLFPTPQVEFLLFECLEDLTGGDLVFLLGVNSLLVDSTTSASRTTRLIMVDAFRYAGRASGIQIATFFKTRFGWGPVFGINLLLLLLNFIYISCVVKEKRVAVEASNGCMKTTLGTLSSYKRLFRARSTRPLLLASLLSMALFFFPSNGQGPLWYLIFRLQYNIDMRKYATMSTAWALRSVVTNLIILPALIHFLPDTILILVSLALTSLAFTLTAFGDTFLWMLLVGFLFALNWPIEKINNSLLSKLVSKDEVGTVFSLLAVMSKCLDFVAKPLYGLLYRATVDTFPAAFLFVSLVFLVMIFIIFIFIHIKMGKKKMLEVEIPEE